MEYLLLLLVVIITQSGAAVPSKKVLSEKYAGLHIERDNAVISMGANKDWNMIYSGKEKTAIVIGNLKVTGDLTAGSSDATLNDLRKEMKSADKSLQATLTNTIKQLKGKITALQDQVQRLSGCASKPCANGGVCKVTDDGFKCDCSKAKKGFVGARCDEPLDSSCKALYDAGKTSSGVYTLKSKDGTKYKTYCDMKTKGGGWTLLGSFVNTDKSTSWSRDVCGDANGWTLLHNTWIPSFQNQVSDQLRAQGQFITPAGQKIKYKQVFFECQTSSGVGVERVVTLGKHETKAAPSNKDPGPGRLQEHRYSHDTCGKGGSKYFKNGGWNEMHYFGPKGGDRFITRKNQVHCCTNYGAVGGEKDNPKLGNFGRVWVRDSTQIPEEADLPSCKHTSKAPESVSQCSGGDVAACESFPCIELGRHDDVGGRNLMYLNPNKKSARISRRNSISDWAFFGLTDQETVWKYKGESSATFGPAKLLTAGQVSFLQKNLISGHLKAKDITVQSDLSLYIQRDDSGSPSYFTYLRLDTFKIEKFQFKIGGTDHTRVVFSAKDSMLRCFATAGGHNKCDKDGNKLKRNGAVRAILIEVHCSPKKGATAHKNQFSRNVFSFSGSHYRVGVRASAPKGVAGIQGAKWNYVNEKVKTVGPVTFFTEAQAKWVAVNALAGKTKNSFLGAPKIVSDLKFQVQRDDSASPSLIKYLRTDTWAIQTFQFQKGGTDHTRVEFANNKFRCMATAGSHDKCDKDGNGLKRGVWIPIIILEVFLSPKEGATAHNNQFFRNQFMLKGTHYYADFGMTATCSCKSGACKKGRSLVGAWKCPGFWLGDNINIPADTTSGDFTDKTTYDYIHHCIDSDGLIHNGNTAWVSDSTFGDVKTYTKADFKSLAFSSLLLNDLMISDPSGHIGFTDVLDGQTMQSKMRGYWGCQTVPQVFPGSSRAFSNQARFKSNAMLLFYGADSGHNNHCALSNFGADNSRSAAIAVGGGDNTALMGLGQWGATYHHGMDSNLKIANANVCATGTAGVKCSAKMWKGVRSIAPLAEAKASDYGLLWGR